MALIKELNKYYLNEGCYINKVNSGVSTPEHTHSFIEIVYIFSGRGIHFVDGYEYPMSAGDMLFINYGSTHRFNVFDKMSYADIIIKPEFISESLKGEKNAFSLLELESFKDFAEIVDRNNRVVHFSAVERNRLKSLILLAYNEQNANQPGMQLVLHSLFNTLLTFVFRKMALPMKKESGIGNELLEFIKANCTDPLTMEEIAAANNYNSTYFSRLFKKDTGYTFTEYLTLCRVNLACKLLKETKLNIADVAVEAGFSDRTKFYKIFAQKVGMTPLKYRKCKE